MSPPILPPGRHVVRDPETGDFAAYYDGELLGYRERRDDAEQLAADHEYEILRRRPAPASTPPASDSGESHSPRPTRGRPFTKANAAAMGAKGGRRTAEKHGSLHMELIGRRGWWATVLKHWNGDPRAYMNYIIALGLAATDAVPQNGAFEHDRQRIRNRARAGLLSYVRPRWMPPEFPADMEPPF